MPREIDEVIKTAEWTRQRDAIKDEFNYGVESMATEILHLRDALKWSIKRLEELVTEDEGNGAFVRRWYG